jgi:hypothetical protein
MSILLESGSSLLAEDGASKLLLESGTNVASFLADHSEIPANRPEGIAIDLRGTGTSWTDATPFAVSDVAGCSILDPPGAIVTSGTLARLVIATGAATGTLHVTDGDTTVNVAVKAYRRRRWFAGLGR